MKLTYFLLLILLLPALCAGQQRIAGTVLRVVDGDTLILRLAGKRENVRLIGIDTPESARNRRATKQAERAEEDIEVILQQGRAAKEYVAGRVAAGTDVRVELDVEERDRYGRLLGYVFLSDGSFLNEDILRDGYAQLYTFPPNVKYTDRFRAALRHARENATGLWSQSPRQGNELK